MKLSDAHDWTALHIAALSNPPLYLIYALLLVFPEGAKELDGAGRLPLHLVAGSEPNICILNTLVRFNNDAVCVKDDRGLIPLHLALLRDGSEEIPVDVLRILLGQNIGMGDAEIRIGGGSRKVRDGYMRNKEHLNLQLDEIQGGILGTSRNTATMRERKRREETMRMMNTSNGKKESLSRGFARNIEDVDSQDGDPHKHEHLSSLWLNEGGHRDRYGAMELREANGFSPEVQHCLKQLAFWKKRYDREHNPKVSERDASLPRINPATIPASPYMRLPIHMAVRRNHQKNKTADSSHRAPPLALPPNQNEILRILIHAFPMSLKIRDHQGKTPLMTCLHLAHHPATHPINLDMIELLLGIRTAGFRAAPQWLEDIDFFQQHQNALEQNPSTGLYNGSLSYASNAAMISCDETLPLHIAARESLPTSIVHAIYTCYPGAKYAQDERECTPLHCALQNMTGSLDLETMYMLMDDKVLRIKNNLNQSIFDLLVVNARIGKIPKQLKGSMFGQLSIRNGANDGNIDVAALLQPVFHHTVVDEVIKAPSGAIGKDQFLLDLYSLPSWLRKQACATPAVQALLLKELTLAMNTSSILLYGIVLLTLTITFGFMVDSFVSHGSENGSIITSNSQKTTVLVTNLYLSFHGLCYVFMTLRLNVGITESLSNIWTWVTFFALLSSFAVTVRIGNQERALGTVDLDDDFLFTTSTVAVGMLWAAVVGYLARWWYGISSFCSSATKVRFVVSTFENRMVTFLILLCISPPLIRWQNA